MFIPKAFQKLICKWKVYYFCLIHDSAPKIYQLFLRLLPNFFFRKGNFAVKRQEDLIRSDKTIEQTISKHRKCHGGITGYSATPATV